MSVGNRSYFALYRFRLFMHAAIPQATATAVRVTRTENEAIAADARDPAHVQTSTVIHMSVTPESVRHWHTSEVLDDQCMR